MRKVFLILVLLLLSSCQISSRVVLGGAGGRNAYNAAIQMTNSQQMLLNLVRLRYVDAPFFLNVSNVTTQMIYRSNISPTFPFPGFNEDNPFLLGGELAFEDRPTITYSPLEGEAFTSRLLRPIQLSTLQQLIYSGWGIDRVFLIMLQNFGGLYRAPEMAEPVSAHLQEFAEIIDIFHSFQTRGELQVGIKLEGKKTSYGYADQTLQILIPSEGEPSQKVLHYFPDAKKEGDKILLSLQLGFNSHGKLGIVPRNILSCMYYLSQAVSVPDLHYTMGLVKEESCSSDGKSPYFALGHFFSVKTSFFEPKNAYISVKYRNYWYYIEDCDLSSKKTFALLLQLYNLHAEQSRSVGPILTLPLN